MPRASHVDRVRSPFTSSSQRFIAGRIGLGVFLISLSMLFAASIVGYAVVRLTSPDWPPRDMPPLPRLLWLSTAVLFASSLTMQWSLVSARRDRQTALRAGMLLTSALAIAFLALQIVCWIEMLRANMDFSRHLYAFTFYVLTALHALHVLGGLGPMLLVTARAFRGRYTSADFAGVHYCAMYWHFLGAVWLVLYATLLLGS